MNEAERKIAEEAKRRLDAARPNFRIVDADDVPLSERMAPVGSPREVGAIREQYEARRKREAVDLSCEDCETEFRGRPGRTRCADCESAHWERVERQQREAVQRRRAEKAERLYRHRVENSEIPAEFRSASLDDLDGPVADVARRWVDGDLHGLLLYGPVGAGKSYAAAAAMLARLRNCYVDWVRVSRLMVRLRMGFGDRERQEADRLLVGGTDVVLDDLDKANPTELGREVLFEMIDGRVSNGVPMIVTTNLPPSKLGKRMGDPIMSRLVGYCEVLEMRGRDRRLP